MSDPKHEAITVVEHTQPATIMHPMVQAAMRPDLDPATLRELLAVQRDWELGEAKKAYTRAMVALKAVLPHVIDRDRTVRFKEVKYTHASLAAAMDAVIPHLTAHGFSLAWRPSTEGNKVTVTCRLTHTEGYSEECSISSPVDTSGSKSTAQGTASTITLLQRYSALSLLGIATADMKDPGSSPGAADEHVDTARNMKAVTALGRLGKTKADIEQYLGRPFAEWTTSDLDKLKAWVNPPKESPE